LKRSSEAILKYIRIISFFTLLIWTSGIFIPCYSNRYSYLTFFSDLFYSTVCHQDKVKTFYFNSAFLSVCARCLGVYSGAFISSLVMLFMNKVLKFNLKPLLIISSPMLADVFLVQFSAYDYSKTAALITGMLFGSIVFIYILSVLENSFSEQVKGTQ
jgi:uncharacterized membrane protein